MVSMINDDPILSFGKYQGEPLSQVAEDNPAYLFWLINNANLSGSLQEQIKDHLSRIKFDPNAENRPFPICPQSGNGAVHARWLLPAARWCKGHRLSSKQAADKLHKRIKRDPSPANEIETAVAKIYNKDPLEPSEIPKSKAVKLDPRLRAKVIAENALTLEELRAASPTNYDDNPNASEEIVDALFGNDNSWICAGLSVHEFATRCRESWRGHLHRMAVIVPSPMRSKFGRAQGGYLSEHTLDNVGPRKFIVVDQDGVPITEQIPILRYLAQFLPLVLIVFSGNESVHGWFHVGGLAQEFVDKFFDHAEALGADHALRSPMQFARVPAGRHKNGNLQRVFFFDPDAINPTQLPAAIFPNSQPDVAPAASVSSLENDPDPPLQDQTNGNHFATRDRSNLQLLSANSPLTLAPASVASLLPPKLPPDIRAILETAPPFGNGLLLWIRAAALTLLRGREPREVAQFLYLVTKHYPALRTEILVLKSR